MPHIVRPQARRLQCKGPHCADNFIRVLEQHIDKHDLVITAIALDKRFDFPLSPEDQQQYEQLDKLRCEGVIQAERKCHKLHMGQVAYSPTVQFHICSINAWNLLIKKAKGLKVSSRMLSRAVKKSNLIPTVRSMGLAFLEEELKLGYQRYYAAKGNAASLRDSFIDILAEAWAMKNRMDKAKILLTFKHHEAQRQTARCIKYLRGKMNIGSTTVISIPADNGLWKDITDNHTMIPQEKSFQLTWTAQAIQFLWKYTRTEWNYRNTVVHGATDQEMEVRFITMTILQSLYNTFSNTPQFILPHHKYFFTSRTLEQ
jgi:hypothetical protein